MAGTVPHPRVPGRSGSSASSRASRPASSATGREPIEQQWTHVVYREFESSADALGADTDAIDPEATVETVRGALEAWGWIDDEDAS